jgi:hypothetical protein
MPEFWSFSEPLDRLLDLTWPYARERDPPPHRSEGEQMVANVSAHIYARLCELSQQLAGACCPWPRGTTLRPDTNVVEVTSLTVTIGGVKKELKIEREM